MLIRKEKICNHGIKYSFCEMDGKFHLSIICLTGENKEEKFFEGERYKDIIDSSSSYAHNHLCVPITTYEQLEEKLLGCINYNYIARIDFYIDTSFEDILENYIKHRKD